MMHADFSDSILLINCLSDIFGRECVYDYVHVLNSVFMQHMGLCLCVQFTHFYFDDCENVCISSYYHDQIRNMNHWPLSRYRS